MKEENVKFYVCPICGNVIELINGKIEHMTCCGKEMQLMNANETDGAVEKHVPVYENVEGEIVVRVGEIEHPMEEEHYIMWIAEVVENEITRINLKPGQKPEVRFKYIPGATIYAYCNKHGLWKTEVK